MDDGSDGSLNPLVRAVLDQLPERDAAIISYRFGIQDGETHTLDETSVKFGVAREGIRNLESAVLGSLRSATDQKPDADD